MEEIQHTTTNGDMISGEFTIKFSDIKLDNFLKYRKTIREMTGFGNICISHTLINEKAIIVQNNLERRPEEHKIAQAPPIPPGSDAVQSVPAAALKGQRNREKEPHMTQISRQFLVNKKGDSLVDVISHYRARFKNTKFSDSAITKMFYRANGIVT